MFVTLGLVDDAVKHRVPCDRIVTPLMFLTPNRVEGNTCTNAHKFQCTSATLAPASAVDGFCVIFEGASLLHSLDQHSSNVSLNVNPRLTHWLAPSRLPG